MELVIIALIAVEVVIVRTLFREFCIHLMHFVVQALIRDGPELWQMAFGSPHMDNHNPAPHE